MEDVACCICSFLYSRSNFPQTLITVKDILNEIYKMGVKQCDFCLFETILGIF